jgi:hypothetical protein
MMPYTTLMKSCCFKQHSVCMPRPAATVATLPYCVAMRRRYPVSSRTVKFALSGASWQRYYRRVYVLIRLICLSVQQKYDGHISPEVLLCGQHGSLPLKLRSLRMYRITDQYCTITVSVVSDSAAAAFAACLHTQHCQKLSVFAM